MVRSRAGSITYVHTYGLKERANPVLRYSCGRTCRGGNYYILDGEHMQVREKCNVGE